MPDHLHAGGEKFIVELEALADDHPPIRRLRHFLKSALRVWRLKCRSIDEITPRIALDERSATGTTNGTANADNAAEGQN